MYILTLFLRTKSYVANQNHLLRYVINSHVRKMADLPPICIACGGNAVKGCRAAADDISSVLKSYISKRCRVMDIEINLDAVIGSSYACRNCAKVYKSHIQKDDRLYQATANSIDYIVEKFSCHSVRTQCTTPRKRTADRDSEVGIPSKKRRTINKNSPTVTVSIKRKYIHAL